MRSAQLRSKVVLVGAVLAVTATIFFKFQIANANYTHSMDALSRQQDVCAPGSIDASLREVLDKKFDIAYHEMRGIDAVWDLTNQGGLRWSYPRTLYHLFSFTFTLEEKQIPLRRILERYAAAGQIDLEYRGNEVVFWKHADNSVLERLEQELNTGNVATRCQAVFDLAQLSDRRIYPLLFKSLQDPDQAVVAKAIVGLYKNHLDTLYCGEGLKSAVDAMLKQLANEGPAVNCRRELIKILGATGQRQAEECLIALLKDANEDVRHAASNSLAWGRFLRGGVDLFMPLLSDADALVRSTAVRALGHGRDPRAFEPILAILHAVDERDSVASIGYFRDTRAVEPLIALLKDSDSGIRQSALESLAEIQDPRGVDPIIALSNDPDFAVRAEVAIFMNDHGGSKAVEPLIALAKDSERSVRNNAAIALGCTRDPRVFDPLLVLIKDVDSGVRSCAAGALGSLGDARAIEPLAALVQDVESDVRTSAADALLRMKDPRAIAPLTTLLSDAEESKRNQTAAALANCHDNEGATAMLLDSLKDSNKNVRASAAQAFEFIDEPRATPLLIEFLKDSDERTRRDAARGLSGLEKSDGLCAVKPLQAILTDADADVRVAAAKTLAKICPGAVPGLAADADVNVRRAAVAGLSRTDPSALPLLIAFTADIDPEVRCLAAERLGSMKDPRAIEPLRAIASAAGDANVRSKAAEALLLIQGPPPTPGETVRTGQVILAVGVAVALLSLAASLARAIMQRRRPKFSLIGLVVFIFMLSVALYGGVRWMKTAKAWAAYQTFKSEKEHDWALEYPLPWSQ